GCRPLGDGNGISQATFHSPRPFGRSVGAPQPLYPWGHNPAPRVTPMLFSRKPLDMPTADTALKGRSEPIPTASTHFITGRPLKGPYPEGTETAVFGL